MPNTPLLTVVNNAAAHTTISTAPPIEGVRNDGELIGKTIAMNLRNRQDQTPEKSHQENMG